MDYSNTLKVAYESQNDTILLMTLAALLTERTPNEFTDSEIETIRSIRRIGQKDTPALALARTIKLPARNNEKPYITDWN